MKKLYVRIINFLATAGYVGYLPQAPGTWGSLLALVLYGLIFRRLDFNFYLLFILLTFFGGIFVSGEYDRLHRKHDAAEIVIDEVVGQSLALTPLFFLPWAGQGFYVWLAAAFVLFRFFDIVKPLGVRQIQKIKGGEGVVMDDVLAGVYTIIVLNILYYSWVYLWFWCGGGRENFY
ncbi:phosphatidylglycerophosphatase A [Candidatus Termititenax persephonae]|uniref:Phosphatidylglycerophosphatase A n=1 Tax=Candidatus Termititenax persephonae TaxID=2218525 RepID=A0A388THH5_9BACT|nr:phosphatidylglycerophosphatase A [Candidatus Termititenax persephonae]